MLEPLVAGELGDGTILDPSTHPPVVSAVEYSLDAPTTEDLIESFPVFLVGEDLAERLGSAGLTGFEFADARVVPSREYREVYGEAPHKRYRWLQPTPATDADCWLDKDHRLIVSERMWRVLATGDLRNAHLTPL